MAAHLRVTRFGTARWFGLAGALAVAAAVFVIGPATAPDPLPDAFTPAVAAPAVVSSAQHGAAAPEAARLVPFAAIPGDGQEQASPPSKPAVNEDRPPQRGFAQYPRHSGR